MFIPFPFFSCAPFCPLLKIIKYYKELYCHSNDDFLYNPQISMPNTESSSSSNNTYICIQICVSQTAGGNGEGKGEEALVFSADGRGSHESLPWSNCRIADRTFSLWHDLLLGWGQQFTNRPHAFVWAMHSTLLQNFMVTIHNIEKCFQNWSYRNSKAVIQEMPMLVKVQRNALYIRENNRLNLTWCLLTVFQIQSERRR